MLVKTELNWHYCEAYISYEFISLIILLANGGAMTEEGRQVVRNAE